MASLLIQWRKSVHACMPYYGSAQWLRLSNDGKTPMHAVLWQGPMASLLSNNGENQCMHDDATAQLTPNSFAYLKWKDELQHCYGSDLGWPGTRTQSSYSALGLQTKIGLYNSIGLQTKMGNTSMRECSAQWLRLSNDGQKACMLWLSPMASLLKQWQNINACVLWIMLCLIWYPRCSASPG